MSYNNKNIEILFNLYEKIYLFSNYNFSKFIFVKIKIM